MIDNRPPTARQSRSFSPLTFRQRGQTLFERGIRSPNQRQGGQAKTGSSSGHRPAIHPERGFLLGRLSNAGLTVPCPPAPERPASETLHHCCRSTPGNVCRIFNIRIPS